MSVNTYTKVLTKGPKANLSSTSIGNNVLRFTTDTKELFLDKDGTTRMAVSNVDTSMTEQQIKDAQNHLNKLYLASDTMNVFSSDGTNLQKIGGPGGDYDYGDLDEGTVPESVIALTYNPSEVFNTDNQPYHPVMYGEDRNNTCGYSDDFWYNPATGELRFGGISIKKTLDSSTGEYVIDISIV